MSRRLATLAAVLLAGLVLAACGSDDTGGTIAEPASDDTGDAAEVVTKVDVKAANFSFDPKTIALTAGQSVQFVLTNGDQVKHNITVEGLRVDKDADGGKTEAADVTKDLKAGTYDFSCEYHPAQMQGTITVT